MIKFAHWQFCKDSNIQFSSQITHNQKSQ